MTCPARSHGQTGASAATGRPPIPPAIKRNTLLLAVTQACVGVGNQMVPALGGDYGAAAPGFTGAGWVGVARGRQRGAAAGAVYPLAGTARAQSGDLWDASRALVGP